MSSEKRPSPSGLLDQNLFNREFNQTIKSIADGISSVRTNGKRLLSDARLMQDAGRLATARFLITTAREEVAKAYILLDMCRLDFHRHKSVLHRLCGAFYDHLAKHAYIEVLTFGNIKSMVDAKSVWERSVKQWWPGSLEDGEPDLPHETYFGREMPLYVDIGDYDQKWLVPADTDHTAHFEPIVEHTPISDAQKLIDRWDRANSLGLCAPAILAKVNQVFSRKYVKETTGTDTIIAMYRRVAEDLGSGAAIYERDLEESPLYQLPLYHFVTEGF